MKSIQLTAACAAVLIGLTGSRAGAEETARDIAVKFETEKAAALEAYLADNAEAEDREEATALLIETLLYIEDSEKLIPLLTERYTTFDKGPEANVELLVGMISRPLVLAYKMAGKKDEALVFIEQVKTDFDEHPLRQPIHQFFDDLARQLDLPEIGDTMEFAFTDINGEEVDTEKLKGKVVLVDFWATWCTPCIAEMPNLISAYEAYKDKGFEVVGISFDEDRTALEAFLSHPQWAEMDWPQYFDEKGPANELAVKFGVGRLPSTFLLDKEGKVVATDLHGGQLKEMLSELLDSDSPASE